MEQEGAPVANEKERGVEDRHAHRVFHHVHPGRTQVCLVKAYGGIIGVEQFMQPADIPDAQVMVNECCRQV